MSKFLHHDDTKAVANLWFSAKTAKLIKLPFARACVANLFSWLTGQPNRQDLHTSSLNPGKRGLNASP